MDDIIRKFITWQFRDINKIVFMKKLDEFVGGRYEKS